MRRLPIRLRVTLAFAGVMAIVLTAIGLAVFLRFQAQLDDTIDHGLRARADEVRGLLAAGRALPGDQTPPNPLIEQGESFVQILRPDGTVLTASPRPSPRPLLTRAQLARAARGTIVIDRDNPFEPRDPSRLLATPVHSERGTLVAVVGTATDDRRDALRTLALLLALGGAAALALASAAGYRVATAALRPVDAMRRKADEITAQAPGERLPVAGEDEIARLGTTLNAMLARLEASFERERGFVADAGHELRTPLAILRTELELALREGRTPQDLHDALRSAAEETERLAQLAEALLVIARADGSDGLVLATRELEAGELFDVIQRRLGARVHDAGRALVADGGDIRLHGDRRRLEQALDNLVDNALTHGAGTIRLRAATRDGHVELHVRDDAGPGFPEPFLARAFDRFTRADPARARGGCGLGLAIVRAVAQAHGGDARAANAVSSGADVWLELPR